MLNLTIEQCAELERKAWAEGDYLKAELYDTVEGLLRAIEERETLIEEQNDSLYEAQGALEAIRELLTKKGF